MLAAVGDRRTQQKIAARINTLASEPEKRGKPLQGELRGIRSLRAAGQRYRILYRLERDRVVVLVVAIGLRKEGGKRDVYSLARKLLRQRLLDPEG